MGAKESKAALDEEAAGFARFHPDAAAAEYAPAAVALAALAEGGVPCPNLLPCVLHAAAPPLPCDRCLRHASVATAAGAHHPRCAVGLLARGIHTDGSLEAAAVAAVRLGDGGLCYALVRSGADAAAMLCLSVSGGALGVARVLLTKLAVPVDSRDAFGFTPLHHAVNVGNAAACELLLASGADVRAVANGNTVLHRAAQSSASGAAVAGLLLAAGCAVDAKNSAGHTALHVAAEGGRYDACALLVAAGASLAALTPSQQTARQLAKNKAEFDRRCGILSHA